MSRLIARSLIVATCFVILLTQALGARAAGTLDRQLDDDDLATSVEAVAGEIDQLWAETYDRIGKEYDSAEIVAFDRTIKTDCGTAKAGRGSIYCPADATVYLDLKSLATIRDEDGAVPAVVVIARLYGLHLLALDHPTDEAAMDDPADARQLGADCWAGLLIRLAEIDGLMPLGTTALIVSYLVSATAASDETDHPAALRVERFLAGYYTYDC